MPLTPEPTSVGDPGAETRPADRGKSTEPSPDTGPNHERAVDPGGPVVGGRYVLGPVLGQGGFGVVHRGFDQRLGRPVAIKVSRTDRLASIGGAAAGLLREARRAAQLQHTGIVTVYDVDLVDGHCLIVTELLDGQTLEVWARREQPAWDRVARLVAAVAEALGHAHARGVIHRDVKPSNIIVVAPDRPVLLDLGLALVDSDAQRERGHVLGTLAYMSPEQARGEGFQPDGRTDLYSLGVILFELTTGRRPHRARTVPDLLWQLHEVSPQPPRQIRPEIPVELERITLRAMARRVEDRYATAADLAADLLRFADALRAAPTSPPPPAPTPPSTSTGTLPTVPLPVSSPSRSWSRSGPERRQVSVLRVEFNTGPSPGAEVDLDFDAEIDLEREHDRATWLGRVCEAAVLARGGLVLPCEGAAFLACFGYPSGREDAPRSAVAAGLEILQRAAGDDRAGPAPVPPGPPPRLAVRTGAVVIGMNDSGAPTIVGPILGETERLAREARPGDLLVGVVTRSMVIGFFECVDVPGSPGQASRVVAGRQAHNRVEATGADRLTPLIGRSREVDLLRDRWEQTAEGVGHVVVLVGDPGLGKSRLVHVVKDEVARADSETRPVAVIEWYASELHQNSPLRPTIEQLLRGFGLAEVRDPAARRARLVEQLQARGITDPTEQSLFATLLSIPVGDGLPTLEYSPDRFKERWLDLLVGWLEREAAAGPVLLIVEDLHWVDPTTRDLLQRFVEGRTSAESAILSLFTTRPEFEAPWRDPDHLSRVALTRLSRRQVTEMMAAQTGSASVSPALVDQILERTDGVPLFVEEFTRMLADAQPDWTANPDDSSTRLRAAAIPATLQDLLVARLDRVGGDKTVVQIGAAVGRSFGYPMLAAVADLDDAALRAELDKLVATGLVFAKGTPPASVYTFKHALIQDAAYQLLLTKPRQRFHRAIAEALETLFPDDRRDRPEVLAHHFTEAGMVRRGIDGWREAGVHARDRSAHREAMVHLHRGLALVRGLEPGPERDALELSFRLPLSASTTSVRGYASPEVEEHIRAARALCERLGGDAPLFPVMMVLWAIRFIQGRMREAAEVSRDLLALAERNDDDGQRVEAHWSGACNSWFCGEFRETVAHAEVVARLYDVEVSRLHAAATSQNSGPLTRVYHALGVWTLGDPARAFGLAEAAVELADQLRHPFSRVATIWHVGHLHQMSGDAAAAIRWADVILAESREQGFAFYIGLGLGLRGSGLRLLGRHDEAISLIRQGLTQVETTGCDKLHHYYQLELSRACQASGRLDEAEAALARALAVNDRDAERVFESEMHRQRAALRVARGDGPAAESALLHALAVAQRQGARFFELRAASDLARLQAAGGVNPPAAVAPIRAALAGFPASAAEVPEIRAARAEVARAGP